MTEDNRSATDELLDILLRRPTYKTELVTDERGNTTKVKTPLPFVPYEGFKL